MPSEASGTFPFNHRASEEAWERCCSAELCRKQRSVRALFLGLSFEGACVCVWGVSVWCVCMCVSVWCVSVSVWCVCRCVCVGCVSVWFVCVVCVWCVSVSVWCVCLCGVCVVCVSVWCVWCVSVCWSLTNFAALQIVALQGPLSMDFSRREYWTSAATLLGPAGSCFSSLVLGTPSQAHTEGEGAVGTGAEGSHRGQARCTRALRAREQSFGLC